MMNFKSRKGVSLVTVLLFMLVATIAATATYKWLSSEGRASVARLLKSEAYQSSQAGIESTRSWMTFHANDVGSLIRQYKEGGNKAIYLNPLLKEITRPDQQYDVWLVGANTEKSTYKVKILASGKGRGGSVYNQVAIFNVDGLYQVSRTKEKEATNIDFEFAYFGGSYTGAGDVSMTSAVVNGNWKGNPQNVQKNFIITGNAELSGNNVNIGNLGCVGGDLTIGNQGLNVKDLYVGGASRNSRITASGDVYFNGDVSQGQTGPIVIDGSVTLNGVMRTNQRSATDNVTIGKNLCVDETKGKVVSGGTSSPFKVEGSVYMPGKQNIIAATSTENCLCEVYWEGMEDGTYVKKLLAGEQRSCNSLSYPYSAGSVVSCSYTYSVFDNAAYYDKIILGGSSESKVYIKGVKESAKYNTDIAKTYSVSGKKYCPEATRFKIKDKNNWERPSGQGHYTKSKTGLTLNVCGSLSGETSYSTSAQKCTSWDWWGKCINWTTPSFEAVDYTRGWQDWTSGNVQLFPQVSASTDKYLIFNESNVSFKDKVLTDWRQFNIPESGSPSQNGTKTPIWTNDWNIGFDDHFKGNVFVGAFVFGAGPEEKLYYNPTTNTNNLLNYENGSPTGSPYCYNDGTPEGKYRPTCGVTPWFKSNATDIKNAGPAEKGQITCAEAVVDRCEEFWGAPTTGCDNSKYKVPDMLVTGKKTFEPFASKGCASDITQWGPNLANELNECYQENIRNEDKQRDNLYNGYLVVKVRGAQGTQNCPSGDFKGNYIILVDDAPIDCQNGLPTVQDGFRTFLYLNKGADNIGNKTTRNYFIYTRDQIKSAKQLNLHGSIYAEARTCAGMGDLQSSSLTYDPELVSDMVQAGIICQRGEGETPEQTEDYCGSSTTSGGGTGPATGAPSSGTTSTVTVENKDAYYVSNAATLSISLESQYRSDEDLPTAANTLDAAGDIVVVPRIIYIPKDPFGELSDYYNVIGLNGLKVNKNSGSARCFGPSTLRTSGLMYNRDGSDSQLTKGEYQCTYSYNDLSVPFYVYVDGESGSTPFVSFTESAVDMGQSTSYDVKIVVPPHSNPLDIAVSKTDNPTNWSIAASAIGNCTDNNCIFKVPASSNREEVTIFTVSTSGASNGTITFGLSAGEGYAVGTPPSITLKYASTVYVSRIEATLDQINTFCNNNSGASCPADRSSWPDCTPSEPWVMANGDNCVTATTNSEWVCGTGSNISLTNNVAIPGCISIIPQMELQSSSFNAGERLSLPASIKAQPMKFKFGFNGKELNGKQITATVVGSSVAGRVNTVSKTCTYGTDIQSTSDFCEIDVFKEERLTLSFIGERPRNFNYWSCEGPSCPATPYSGATLTGILISNDGDKAYAHFDETDDHCFFDEFDVGVECESEYCFTSPKKWRLLTDEFASKVEYHYGHVSAKPNKRDKDGIVVLSRIVPGMSGTLKAQFQVPQISRNESSSVLTSIKNNGFILRSNANATDYLLLSFYVNNEGYLITSLCTNNRSVCKEKRFNMRANSTAVITLTANISSSTIDLFASASAIGVNAPYTTSFNFIDDGFSNYASSGSHIGFRLTDPNFVLYDIGWKSEDYGAQCWDTYPSVNCSFRSAYPGGVVPKEQEVKPWVGLSSWFDDKDCEATYYYKGNDACGSSDADYSLCTSAYNFREEGPHGYKDNSGNEVKTAKAGVEHCYNLTDDERALLSDERAHCGEFWVGEMNKCTESVDFPTNQRLIYSGSSESFNLNTRLNTREATLNIELENEDSSTVEIYLLSQQDPNTNPSYSRSFETTRSGKIAISISDLLDAEGFDPEKVSGVTVSVLEGTNITVKQIYTSCPYVVTLSNCTARFSDDKWHISAYATNYTEVSSFIIENSLIGNTDYSCTNGNCYEENKVSTVPSGLSATYSFNIVDNPYTNHSGETYQFNISMATRDGKMLSCSTNEVQISSIKATCGALSDENVKPGQGVPSFKFTMVDCPNNNCPYRISLDGAEIITGDGNISNGKTSINAANSKANPLAAGEYRFKLESNDPNLPFESCYSDPFTVGNGTSGGSGDDTYNGTICLAGDWPEVSQGKGITAPLTEGTYFVDQDCYTASDWGLAYFYICNGSVTLGDIELNCDGQEKQPTTTLPASANLLTIGAGSSLTKLGCFKSRASCSTGYTPGASSGDTPDTPTFDGEKLTCHIENEAGENLGTEAEINLGESISIKMEYAGQCNNANLYEGSQIYNYHSGYCVSSEKITPQRNVTYRYEVTNGYIAEGIEPRAECSMTVKVSSPETEGKAICLRGEGYNVEFTGKTITHGSYQLLHNCNTSDNWWYRCNGDHITINGTDYGCALNGDNSYYGNSKQLPASKSTLVIPEGTILEKFGCITSGTPVCSETGVIDDPGDSGDDPDPETPLVPGEIVGTICLNGNWPEIPNNLGSGTYSVNHGCTGSYGDYRIYYICSGDVSWGSHKLNCTNYEIHDDFMPTSADNTLIVGAGSSVTKFGCVGGTATSCETGYTAGAPESSSSQESSSSSAESSSSSSENSGDTGESTNEPATFNKSQYDYKINNGTTIISIETNQYNCPTIYCKSSGGNMTAILDGENMGTGNWLNKKTSGCTTGTTTYSLTVNVDDALCGYW